MVRQNHILPMNESEQSLPPPSLVEDFEPPPSMFEMPAEDTTFHTTELLPPPAVPGIAQSLGLGGVYVGALFVILLPLFFVGVVSPKSKLDYNTILVIGEVLGWAATLWVGMRWSGATFDESFRLRRFPLWLLPGLVLASIGTSLLFGSVAHLFPTPQFFKDDAAHRATHGGQGGWLLFALVIAPVAEELFFRGQVLRGYLGRYSVRKAVIASAVYFSLFHLNLPQACVALPLGVICAWLVLQTGSVLPGILYHAVTNITVLLLTHPLLSLLQYDARQITALKGSYPAPLLLLATACAVTGGLMLRQQLASQPLESGFEESPSV